MSMLHEFLRQLLLLAALAPYALYGVEQGREDDSNVSIIALIHRLADPDVKVKVGATRALGDCGREARAAIPALFDQLDPAGKSARYHYILDAESVVAIVRISPENTDKVIDILFSWLAHSDQLIRWRGAAGFERLGQSASQKLWKSLADPKTPRALMVEVISILSKRNGIDRLAGPRGPDDLRPLAEAVIPTLRTFVREDDRYTSHQALTLLALVVTRDDEIAELFLQALRAKGEWPPSEAALGRALKPDMIPRLAEDLKNPDRQFRIRLLTYIDQLARKSRSERRDRATAETTREERDALEKAARIMARAVPSVVRLVNDSDPSVRWNAARLLGQLGAESEIVVPALLNMVRTDRGRTSLDDFMFSDVWRPSIYFGRGWFTRPISREGYDVRLAALLALGDLGAAANAAVPALIEIVRVEKEPRSRWFAVAALGDIGPAAKAAVPVLVELLKSQEIAEPDREPSEVDGGSIPMRLAAAVALGGIGPGAKAGVPALAHALTDHDQRVCTEAATALGRIGPGAAAAIPILVRLTTEDPEHTASDAAAHALAKIGSAAVPSLIEHVKMGVVIARVRFLTALGEAGPDASSAIPELLHALTDRDEAIRAAAARSLGFVGGSTAATTVIPRLIAALKDSESVVRANAVDGLERIGPRTKDVIPSIASALRDPDQDVRDAAFFALVDFGIQSVPAVLPLLGDADAAASDRAVSVLSELAAAEAQFRPLGETKEQVPGRVRAVRAVLFGALKDPNEHTRARAAQALGEVGDSVVQDLVGALTDPSALVRVGAIRALALVGHGARLAIGDLQKCLNDPDNGVRAAAEAAIREIPKSQPFVGLAR